MSWNGSEPFAYDMRSIFDNTPSDSGVFVILSGETWVYVGESSSLLGSLLLEVSGENTCIREHHPTHFMYQLVPSHARRTIQAALIQEFQPVCN